MWSDRLQVQCPGLRVRKTVIEPKFTVGADLVNLGMNQAEVTRHRFEAELPPLRKGRLRGGIREQFLLKLFEIDVFLSCRLYARLAEARPPIGAPVQHSDGAELREIDIVILHQVGIECKSVFHYVWVIRTEGIRSTPYDSWLIVNISLRAVEKVLLHCIQIDESMRQLSARLQPAFSRGRSEHIEPIRIAQPWKT